jgi:tRNA uridine 5-carbamoylmethylation protein Kti12
MAKETTGATGRMQLTREEEESPSTHWEHALTVHLEASEDGRNVQLTEREQVKDFIKTSNNEDSTVRYEISVSDLISLIKQHGKRVRFR